MRIKLTVILLFIFFPTLVFSQANPVLSYLPGDAKMIIKINSGRLAKKINWDELMQTKMFEDLTKQAPDEGKDLLKDPSQAGVDLSQGFYVVTYENKNSKKAEPTFYGMLKDTAQFRATIKKLNPEKKMEKAGSVNWMIDKNTVIGWNHEIFIISGNPNKKDQTNISDPKAKAAADLAKTKQLIERCKSLLTKKQVQFSNESFNSLLKEDGDVLVWSNNSINSQPKNNKSAQLFGMGNKNFRKGTYSTTIVNFENGKITCQSKRYLTPSLDSLHKQYPLQNINTGLLEKLPAGLPFLIGSVDISPQMLKEFYSKSGIDKFIDSISQHKIKTNDILSSLKGDISVGILKAYEFGKEDTVTQAMGGVQLFVTGHISDKEKFKALAKQIEEKMEDTANKKKTKMKPIILYNDSIFVISLSQIAGQKFLDSNGTNEETKKLLDPYLDYPAAFLINLKNIFGMAMPLITKGKSEDEAKKISDALDVFDKMTSYGGHYTDKYILTNFDLTLTNKDENSLKQLFDLINLAYLSKQPSNK
jgi:hypothetical protein